MLEIHNASTTTKTPVTYNVTMLYVLSVPLVEFIYLASTCMPGESYHRRLRSLLLYLCYIFQVLINSLVGCFCASALGLIVFQISV